MRQLIIISLILTTTSSFFGQVNQIVVENKIWSNVLEDCQPEGNTYTTFYHRFEGDTMLDGKIYKKVLIAEDEYYENWFFYGSFIREEDGKVYLREYLGEEGLIYDFNLQLNDTITIDNPLAPEGLLLELIEIDSVDTFDGYRKRWKLEKDKFSSPEYWIEGVGSESGVLNSGTAVFGALCGTYTLLCEKENDITIYQNPEYGTCFYMLLDVDTDKEKSGTKFEVNYSRNSDLVRLTFNDKDEKVVRIISITGNQLFKRKTKEHHIVLSKSDFVAGLYVISLIQNGKIYSEKVVF